VYFTNSNIFFGHFFPFPVQQTLFMGHPCEFFPSTSAIYEAPINNFEMNKLSSVCQFIWR
jgi:hypothetical protein